MLNNTLQDSLASLKGITFASRNICSITRKLEDVKLILQASKLDLLLINESWLNCSIEDHELNISGYTTHRFNRNLGSSKRGGGGLLAFCRDHHSFSYLQEWNVCSPDLEIQWLRLSLPRNRPTYVANVYRPPSGNIDNCLSLIENKILDIYAENPGDIVLMGDWNIDLFKQRDPATVKYKTFMKICGLSQVITTATRVGQQRSSLIDHALTNREEYYHQWGVVDYGMSDHSLIFVTR